MFIDVNELGDDYTSNKGGDAHGWKRKPSWEANWLHQQGWGYPWWESLPLPMLMLYWKPVSC